jgi:hypothetical protein
VREGPDKQQHQIQQYHLQTYNSIHTMASVAMSQSPVSDPGYGSSTSTPWLEKDDCERFPDEREEHHTLLQMDGLARIEEGVPGSPSPPPSHQASKSLYVSHSSKPSLSSSHNYGHELNASISSRRAATGLLPLSISTLSPPSIRLDLPAPAISTFYDSEMYWL